MQSQCIAYWEPQRPSSGAPTS